MKITVEELLTIVNSRHDSSIVAEVILDKNRAVSEVDRARAWAKEVDEVKRRRTIALIAVLDAKTLDDAKGIARDALK